ncbi:HdeD family acid-resistance protein [Bradyrhizobium sp. SYSU BS000235]|uniref:HdeD family acid-resistance protein n=1 Tax=Bradyrhizobium sp. SYSU BS000235 TaxID=3411332 RepID=UPI003C7586A3
MISTALPVSGPPLLHTLAENWWLVLLRGIAALVLGVLAFVWPGITLVSLILLWGIYALADGLFAMGAAIAGRGGGLVPRWWLAIVGIAGVLAGILTFVWPGLTAQILLLMIACWAIVIGVMQIWGAIQLRKEIEGEWLLILSGLLGIAFGVVLLSRPGIGALAVVWMIGCYAIITGVDYIALAFKLRKYKHLT